MILLDANILLYAYDPSSARHERARSWLEDAMSGDEPVGLPLISILAFVRISTNPTIFPDPLSISEAMSLVRIWLDRPNVTQVTPTDRHWAVMTEAATVGRARGPLVMDAHLAALALEHGATLATTDRGFARFRKLKTLDPT